MYIFKFTWDKSKVKISQLKVLKSLNTPHGRERPAFLKIFPTIFFKLSHDIDHGMPKRQKHLGIVERKTTTQQQSML